MVGTSFHSLSWHHLDMAAINTLRYKLFFSMFNKAAYPYLSIWNYARFRASASVNMLFNFIKLFDRFFIELFRVCFFSTE